MSDSTQKPAVVIELSREVLALRAENERLKEKLARWEAIDLGKIDAIAALQAEIARLSAALEQSSRTKP